jgi:hypothetical protein
MNWNTALNSTGKDTVAFGGTADAVQIIAEQTVEKMAPKSQTALVKFIKGLPDNTFGRSVIEAIKQFPGKAGRLTFNIEEQNKGNPMYELALRLADENKKNNYLEIILYRHGRNGISRSTGASDFTARWYSNDTGEFCAAVFGGKYAQAKYKQLGKTPAEAAIKKMLEKTRNLPQSYIVEEHAAGNIYFHFAEPRPSVRETAIYTDVYANTAPIAKFKKNGDVNDHFQNNFHITHAKDIMLKGTAGNWERHTEYLATSFRADGTIKKRLVHTDGSGFGKEPYITQKNDRFLLHLPPRKGFFNRRTTYQWYNTLEEADAALMNS